MSRNTVKAYLSKLEKQLVDPSAGQIPAMEEPEIYHLFHPDNPPTRILDTSSSKAC
jgi:hypothetical protein